MSVDPTQDEEVVRLTNIITEHRALLEQNPDTLYPAYADALMSLASRLSALEKPDEALTAALDGVEHYSLLVDAEPEHYRVHLASACNNLSNRLAENGHDEDARLAGEQAVSLARAAISTHPEQGRFVLISALMNQATRLRHDNNVPGALEHLGKAATSFREGGEAMLPYLGIMVESLHRAALELAVADYWLEAVAVRRLTAECFGASMPLPVHHLLALSLEQAAHAISTAGHPGEALPLIQEAVTIARKLAEENHQTYGMFLAQSLSSLAARLHENGTDMDAMQAASEAIALFQKVSESDAAAAVVPLSMTMETFATILTALGHDEQAASVLEQRNGLIKLLQDAQALATEHQHDDSCGCAGH